MCPAIFTGSFTVVGIVQHMSVGPETEDESEVKQPGGGCRFAAGLSDQSDNGIVRAQGKVATVFKSPPNGGNYAVSLGIVIVNQVLVVF